MSGTRTHIGHTNFLTSYVWGRIFVASTAQEKKNYIPDNSVQTDSHNQLETFSCIIWTAAFPCIWHPLSKLMTLQQT